MEEDDPSVLEDKDLVNNVAGRDTRQNKGHDILSSAQSKRFKNGNRTNENRFKASHALLVAFLTLLIALHALGIYLFTNGFLLTRLVLDQKSNCAVPPIALSTPHIPGSFSDGCWHPKVFDKAIIVLVDALRYDFTIPFEPRKSLAETRHFHNGLSLLYDTAVREPTNAFLRPFIADPPTTTLQRLKGLTTGTLPTFVDAGSSFSGTAIEEDNLISQLGTAKKNVVHLGDDTWHSLFPGQFDANLTRAFDSFNAWDLHTVDNGVSEHLFPLLQPSNYSKWDILIAHYLGVDHAGHRYGPDHPAMGTKLQQMDEILRRVKDLIDDDTLLIVMGDHGMDSKGDHGGESEDEVEAAIWMYAKRGVFGRTLQEYVFPPATAKERPVNQIDLVPTLALLLGLPIPFNNLGIPIDEAFIGSHNDNFENLAAVTRLTAAQTYRYQQEYALVRKPDTGAIALPFRLWTNAIEAWETHTGSRTEKSAAQWQAMTQPFLKYQQENLRVCKSLWARFDLVSMSMGVTVTCCTLLVALLYVKGLPEETSQLNDIFIMRGLFGLTGGLVTGFLFGLAIPSLGPMRISLFFAGFACSVAFLVTLSPVVKSITNMIPQTLWGWICTVSVVLLSLGFGSNSYTVWEDETLLFLLTSFGVLMLTQSFRLRSARDRSAGVMHSIIFAACVRLASLSRLCRDEQLTYCKPTFYASATSSTSAPWQLAISYAIALIFPSIIKAYYQKTQSYHGSAPFWIGVAFRIMLLLIAIFWTLDAADDGEWLNVSEGTLKTIRVYIAQLVLLIATGAGTATFAWQGPNIGINTFTPRRQAPINKSSPSKGQGNGIVEPPATELEPPKPQIVVQGTSNLYGAHFIMLPFTVILVPLLLLQKPMGQAVLALITIAILSLLELLHLFQKASQSAKSSIAPVGPTILALLGHFGYFKTGHQAALSSIQWTAAYIPLHTLRYPWAPIFILMNTFAGQILCAAAVPCVVLWRRPYKFSTKSASTIDHSTIFKPPSTEAPSPAKESSATVGGEGVVSDQDRRDADRRAILTELAKAHLTHVIVYGTINLATTVFAGHLRRHLMLYRVFCPRWMLGGAGLMVVEVIGCMVGVGSIRWTIQTLARLFGW